MLCDISFTAGAGQTTAIIGSTGSGKTTLLNLVPRLFDATAGAVLVDGVDVRDLEPELLWSRIGLVPQKPYLFSGTVASNLRYANPDATDDELWEALEIAQAARLRARRCPAGSTRRIAQGGTNVSGGQRQRLAIARALVRKPGIYLFDDSFSALDLATDARLRAALAPGGRATPSTVIVAQRVSTIINADQILVLEDGATRSGSARHDELLETCPTYAEIVASQLTRGGGGMSDDDARPPVDGRRGREPSAARATSAPAGMGGRFGAAGMPLERSKDFKNSTRRLARPAAAARRLGDRRRARPRGRQRHAARCSGPKVLGHATNIIVDGVTSGKGIDFAELHRTLLVVARPLRRRRPCWRTARRTCSPASCSARCSACAPTSRTSSTACRCATSTASRAATCSAGSPTTSTTSPRACSRR